MKLRNYILVLLLVLLGVNANQQKAYVEPQPILWGELAHVIDGIELNYQGQYSWIRYSLIPKLNDPTKLRLCYKMDVSQKPHLTQGWVSTFNYALSGWTQAYGTLTDSEKAWCWQ